MIELSLILFLLAGPVLEDFTKDRTLFLKAFLPFFVIASHYCPKIIMPNWDIPLLGPFAVRIFFFISGYGLSCKCRADINGLKLSYIVKKIIGLLIPLIVSMLLYLAICYNLLDNPPKINIVANLKSNYLVHPITWFVITIINLYIIFYMVQLVKKHLLILLALLVVSLMFFQWFCDVPSVSFISDLAFVAGCFFAKYKDKLNEFSIRKIKIRFAFFVVLMFVPVQGIVPITSFFISIFFIMLFCSIKKGIWMKNRVVDAFANISYELYLVQMISAEIIYYFFENRERSILSFLLIVIGSVFLASVIHPLGQIFTKLIISFISILKNKAIVSI